MARQCRLCGTAVGQWSRLCTTCSIANRDDAQRAAHTEVARARRRGLLADPRTLQCADCGGAATEYEHREYAKPLEVEPVCRGCNLRRGPAIDSKAWASSPAKNRRAVEA